MLNILIVESDTPAIVSAFMDAGTATSSGCYVNTFNSFSDNINTNVIQPYADDFTLALIDFDAYDGVVFTGAHVPWSADAAEASILRETIEAAFTAGKPIYGSCNGFQLAAIVLGGECSVASMGMEIGIARDITLSTIGKTHPLHIGRTEPFAALCVHRDHISKIPSGAIVTAGNNHSPVQAMVYEQGNIVFWGTQYHPEYSMTDIIDNLSDESGLFQSKNETLIDLQAARHSPRGEAAQRLAVRGDDLQPQKLQTELRNWVKILI